ncbi:FG-GAP repeat domain-containing protein [Trichloromonas sp.]|uniref:FG-GAP repeat domain-containing protein n=1 Tax=Trichloromonas sp. TaxID=3069249 RepID=UPI003D81B004
MRFIPRRFRVALIILLVQLVPAAALAGLAETVGRDFKPLAGVVVMPVDGQYIIDLDAASGVVIGDLFSVVKPGANIIHPVTGAVLGKLDEVKAVLQVVRVKSGYSYVRALDGSSGIVKGETIRRYESLPATFWDYTGQGEATYAELKNALPSLEWQDYRQSQASRPEKGAGQAADATGLTFVFNNDRLLVHGPDFQVLRTYPVAGASVPVAAGAAPVTYAEPVATAAPSSLEARLRALEQQAAQSPAIASSGPYRLDAVPAAGGLSFEASFPGYKNVGNLTGVTAMSDFARSNGQLLLAATDGKDIKVYTAAEALSLVAEADTSYIAQILSVQWWQPAAGRIYLAASTWNGSRVQSAIFELVDARLVSVDENIGYLLGSFDQDADGSNELLIAQGYDVRGFFGSSYYRMELAGGKVTTAPLGLELPRRFPVQGSLFADVTGDGKLETLYIRDNLLYIYQGDRQLYKSPKIMGGSLSIASYETNVNNPRDSVMDYASFDVRPVAVDLDGDGIKEVVAVASERSTLNSPGIGPGVQKSWLAVFKFRGNMFVKGTLGAEVDTPIQGLAMDKDRVLFVASEPASLLGEGGASHLLSYELTK